MSAALAELRAALADRFPDTLPIAYRAARAVGTGFARLDALLPGNGLPRGRLSVWAPGGGATSVLTAACCRVVERGERAAWVDGCGSMTGEFWWPGPLLLRPKGECAALMCAEELLRSGGFALVVLGSIDGTGRELAEGAVRLTRAAREGGAAFVAIALTVPVAHLRLNSCIAAENYRWRKNPFGEPIEPVAVTLRVAARSLGWSGHTELRLPVLSHGQRIALDPLRPDRRGVRRSVARGGKRRQWASA
jgi:hypothetical protein